MPIGDFKRVESQPLSMASTSSGSEGPSQEEKPSRADVAHIIGGYGPWQRNIFVLLFLASIPSTWHNLMMTFMAPPGIDFWCARPPDLGANVPVSVWRNRSATPDGWDSCQATPFWRNGSQAPVKCRQWEYNTTFYSSTIINEWDLVCDREWLVSLSKSIYNIGYLLAVFVFGQLSDSFGRRYTILASFVINVSAGILSAFSTSFALFAVLRFFTAVGAAGFYTVSFVLLMELVSSEHRSAIGIGINFGWCLAFMSLPAVAWIVRDWFWLQLAVTLPKLLFFPVFWMIPESPRWLYTHKKTDEFRETVTKAAERNGRESGWIHSQIDNILFNVGKEDKDDERKATIIDLLKAPVLWVHILNLFYNWLVNSFIYFGLSYNTENLAGDVYLNFFVSGAVEFPAYLCAIFVANRMGRRLPLAFGMCAGGAACALSIAVPEFVGSQWVKIVLSMVGKFFITATFALVYVVTAEICPTEVRNVGVGTGSTVARVGSTLAPFVKELDAATGFVASNVVFAALSVSSGLLVLCLPETRNAKITDTLQEAAEAARSKEKRDKHSSCPS